MGMEQYSTRFSQIAEGIKTGPREQRQCNDICCYFTFLLMLFAFIGMGIYGYSQGNQISSFINSGSVIQNPQGINSIFSVFQQFYGVIIGMLVLSFILSIIYLFLVKAFPRCIVYTSMIVVLAVLVAIIILSIAYQIYGVAIGVGITLLIMVCCLCCFRNQIETGIVLLKASGQFLTEKPSVYLVPLYIFGLSVLFLIYWVVSIICIQYSAYQDQQNNQSFAWQGVFMAYWIFYFIFMTQFFYYCQTFLVSTACSFWYYGIQQNFFCKGSGWLNFYHIGSLTFGALIVTIIKIVKNMAQQAQRRNQNDLCVTIVLCLVSCCLQCLQNIFKTLNQNAVIVMAVSGESYWDSAKTGISIIFDNIGLFNVIDIIQFIVMFLGLFIAAGIPALLALIIVRFNYGIQNYQLAIVTLVVLFLSILIVVFFVGLLGLVVNCIFIYYCMDKKFKNMGINILNAPPTIAYLFDQQNQQFAAVPSAQQLRPINRNEPPRPPTNNSPPYPPNYNPNLYNPNPNNPYNQPNLYNQHQYNQQIPYNNQHPLNSKNPNSFYQYQNNKQSQFAIE